MHRIKILLICLVLTLIVNPAAFAFNDNIEEGFSFDINYRSVRIPVRISHNLVVVPMRINDSPPLNFILDTGVNTTILTEPLIAHFFEFPIDELVYVLGLGNEGIIEAGMSRGLTFKLNNITGNNMNLIILPEGILSFSEIFGFPVHGILGYDFFKEFPVQINYRNNSIRIFRTSSYRIRRRSKVLPLHIQNNKPYIDVTVVGADSTRVDSLRLLVDMGATNPLFLNGSFKYLAPETISAYLGKGISGDLKGEMGRLKKMKINGFDFRDPLVAFPQEEFLSIANLKFDWQGIIGGGILSRFHLIIDYTEEQIVLRRNRNYRDPFQTNPSGLEIVAQGANYNEYMVSYVRENSPAYEQDIRTGDQIIRITNEETARLSLDDVVGLLNQYPGTVVRLEVLRGNSIYRKTITLREDI